MLSHAAVMPRLPVQLPWLRGPRFDMLTILGLPAVVLAGLVIGWPGLIGQAGPWYQALSANPHLTATYIRLGTEPALRRR